MMVMVVMEMVGSVVFAQFTGIQITKDLAHSRFSSANSNSYKYLGIGVLLTYTPEILDVLTKIYKKNCQITGTRNELYINNSCVELTSGNLSTTRRSEHCVACGLTHYRMLISSDLAESEATEVLCKQEEKYSSWYLVAS